MRYVDEMRVKAEVVGVLDEAINLIKTHGLAKKTFHSTDGRYCMAGALNQAGQTLFPDQVNFFQSPQSRLALTAVSKAIAGPETTRSPHFVVQEYNDAFWRMKWQVLKKLEAAKAFA